MELGQAVDEPGEQIGTGVGGAVPLLVVRGRAQTEVRSEVDHQTDPIEQLGDDLLAGAVRQPEEHDVDPVEQGRGPADEVQTRVGRRQARVERGHRGAGLRVPGGEAHAELRMLGTESQQLCSGEPGRSDDADLDHGETLAIQPTVRKFMQAAA